MYEPEGQQEPNIVIAELDELLDSNDLRALSERPMDELRALRDRLSAIEVGLSYGRRMAQGRLDILLSAVAAHISGGTGTASPLVAELSGALAGQSRTQSIPRPVREVEIPDFADQIVAKLDEFIAPSLLVEFNSVERTVLVEAAERTSAFEQAISRTRHEVHRVIDEVQDEIITRYRTGVVTVDELLA
ncbi:MAG TPA: hypothetical protein DEG43_11315 [Acidimicrobiaceae bacterium]|jgi:hypothetical protein|nr:hypothetical protein [Acidimicrobiaceae bacterium]